ncbi:outer membrane protein assembly factor BamB family protein [Saccharibacillus alkalitolerans]|uniref:PQQ-binding-like beta-propeller repeat protein n=1 Tax=Saccharibacillus alkalitolerans TaxID=2705290 RepID=A0ABX0F2F5_9BACL|nr:PQQ-binding-like beta-propeller repeat protein [Saccharibacillus alkalitolerans]NGZ74605.1 PQQ-binding-like beta-propeller repeat protein [Saccharibacillus alkalitolerans]
MPVISRFRFMAGICLSAALLAPSFGAPGAEASAAKPAGAASEKTPAFQTLRSTWKADNNGESLYARQLPVSNGLVFYTDSRRTLHAADVSGGKTEWSIPHAGSPQAIAANGVVFLDASGRLVKADSSSGKVLWRTPAVKLPDVMGARVNEVGGLLLVIDENSGGGLSAFDPASGKRKWKNADLSMYAGNVVGQFGKTLVVSSTVDNMRTQFFGIDLSTGKKLWRKAGLYDAVGQEQGKLVLREVTEQANRLTQSEKPFRGYMLRLALLDPATGKIVKTEKYGLSQDARLSTDSRSYIVGSRVFGVETSWSPDLSTLVRYERGRSAPVKSYAEYGDLVSDLQEGYFFFQKNGELTALRAENDKTISFGKLPAHVAVTGVRVSNGFAFAGLDNGDYYILDMKSGKTAGVLPTKSDMFGDPFVQDGRLLIQTQPDLLSVKLP